MSHPQRMWPTGKRPQQRLHQQPRHPRLTAPQLLHLDLYITSHHPIIIHFFTSISVDAKVAQDRACDRPREPNQRSPCGIQFVATTVPGHLPHTTTTTHGLQSSSVPFHHQHSPKQPLRLVFDRTIIMKMT
jgi:hypothetical protein